MNLSWGCVLMTAACGSANSSPACKGKAYGHKGVSSIVHRTVVSNIFCHSAHLHFNVSKYKMNKDDKSFV